MQIKCVSALTFASHPALQITAIVVKFPLPYHLLA
jgi:hypothetical protein